MYAKKKEYGSRYSAILARTSQFPSVPKIFNKQFSVLKRFNIQYSITNI